MTAMADFELLDCGDGRRLERFGSVVVDRVAPAAVMPAILPETEWHRAPLAWGRGGWVRGGDREPWRIRVSCLTL
jgi:23S rRNA (cytosine1962-C5)-methyltransferase